MSGFSAFRPLNLYLIPPCPLLPPTTIPACTNSAVFSPDFAILSTSPDCTVTVCCTMYRGPVTFPPYSLASLSVTWICPTEISFGVTPCAVKNFSTISLSVWLFANTCDRSFPVSLKLTGQIAISDLTVLSTSPFTVTYRSASLMSLICDPSNHPPSTNPSSKHPPRTTAGANGLAERSVSKTNLHGATAEECSSPNPLSIGKERPSQSRGLPYPALSLQLKIVPKQLVIHIVVELHLRSLHNRAQQPRTPVR